jgi:hypothetical protein
MATVVELEIEPNELNKGFAFVLDDAVQGILQESSTSDYDFFLGGKFLVDITSYAKSVKVTRGKSRETDTYNPGLANVVFNNHDRTFDPLYTASPLYTHIVPKRVIRVTYQAPFTKRPIFVGFIDDWNLTYDLVGDSIAAAAASDSMSLFSTLVVPPGLQTPELTGARLVGILSQPEFAFPWYVPEGTAGGDTPLARIGTGAQLLAADTVEDGQNALGYFQQVAESEPGAFFVDGDGKPTFLDRRWTPSTVGSGIIFTDDLDSVPDGQVGYAYNEVAVQYGSELLFNEVVVKSGVEDITATAVDIASQAVYGTRTLVRDGILITDIDDLVDMSVALANRYSLPEYRFESLGFVEGPNENQVIPFADLGTLVQVRYTPNGIGDPIERYAEVISFDYEADTRQRRVKVGLSSIDQLFWTLDSPVFGRLSAGNRMGY